MINHLWDSHSESIFILYLGICNFYIDSRDNNCSSSRDDPKEVSISIFSSLFYMLFMIAFIVCYFSSRSCRNLKFALERMSFYFTNVPTAFSLSPSRRTLLYYNCRFIYESTCFSFVVFSNCMLASNLLFSVA